jgi:diguanylate cyclase (GGDEF)-like protein/PAS domain S-box-containing protein
MSPVDSQVPLNFGAGPIDAAASLQRGSQGVERMLEDLANLTPSAFARPAAKSEARYENKLAIVRLGVATSLFSALRAKHPPSASHSLRVALVCSAWADRLQFEPVHRDRLEVAALLHDVGKISIPDLILRKPGKLTLEEQLTMGLSPEAACEILSGCCHDDELLGMIRYANCWYSGRRDQPKSGEEIPIGARMLSIADAFDAMTSAHVYRSAMSREAAMSQVLNGGGTQFDPDLAHDFCLMMQHDAEQVHRHTLLRWMRPNDNGSADERWAIRWQPALDFASHSELAERVRFHDHLLNHMSDAVIYVDRNHLIQGWNYAAEKLTGIAASAVLMHSWVSDLLSLHDEDGCISDACCPIRRSLLNASPVVGLYTMQRNDGTSIPVQLHVAPVASDQPGLSGVVLIIRDASREQKLEARVESLHKQATQDPLTKVSNRAAFDRFLNELVLRREETGASFSLVICDIDHFKRVNDIHGHQAGDEALITFASVLSAQCREGDLVSRYGGEEFVLLSPDCDIATAAKRAEMIRQTVEKTLLPSIGNQAVTASFGVTEVQAGDSADSVLARADRALLQAKDNGRNQVIQLGMGGAACAESPEMAKRRRGIWSWLEGNTNDASMSVEILTPVPVDFAIEKLRGFIADHKAEILSVTEGNLQLKVNVQFGTRGRRSVDSQMAFNVRLRLKETILHAGTENRKAASTQTRVKVELDPIKPRDRRRQEASTCANQIVLSLKSYLMGRIAE